MTYVPNLSKIRQKMRLLSWMIGISEKHRDRQCKDVLVCLCACAGCYLFFSGSKKVALTTMTLKMSNGQETRNSKKWWSGVDCNGSFIANVC